MQPITNMINQSLQHNGAVEFIADHLAQEYFDKDLACVTVKEIQNKLKTFFPYQNQDDKITYEHIRNETFFKMILLGTRRDVEELVQRAFFALDRLLEQSLVTHFDAAFIADKIKKNVLFFEKMSEYEDDRYIQEERRKINGENNEKS